MESGAAGTPVVRLSHWEGQGTQATMGLLSLVFKVFACSGKWLGSDHANSSPVQASDELDVGAGAEGLGKGEDSPSAW